MDFTKAKARTLHTARVARAVCALLAVTIFCGCESASKEPSVQQRHQKALDDPFGYGPSDAEIRRGMLEKRSKSDEDRTDISGGGTFELDKRGLKRDWDALLNP